MTISPLSLVPPTRRESQLEAARQILKQEGAERLADHELLALCLGPRRKSEVLTHAAHVLERAGGLGPLSRLRASGLMDQSGLSQTQCVRVVAALELGRRATLDQSRPRGTRPFGQEAVEEWATPRLAGLDHEEVWVLCLNAASQLQSTFQVARGGMHGCGLLARDVLTPVVRDAAGGFVLVHNHPSGDPRPSPEDIELTRSLQKAASTLCLPLLDHVIVARNGATSFFQTGLLDS